VLAGCTRQPENKTLNLFAWSEYVPQAVIDGFTKETGIQVNYESYASNEEMLAKLVSGAEHYDLIQPSEYAVEALVRTHRLMPIDWAKVPKHQEHRAQYTHQGHDPEQRYTVPWMAGSVGIVGQHGEGQRPRSPAYRGTLFQDKFAAASSSSDDSHREIVAWALNPHRQGGRTTSTTETRAARSNRCVRALAAAGQGYVRIPDSPPP
jgi:spermidine/putrescine transport system substrate-binding protein